MNKSISRTIEKLIESCPGNGFRQVREKLEEAARAARRAESKSEERADQRETPFQKWVFDSKTGSMRNLTRDQMNGALARIEGMIRDEKGKVSDKESDGLIMG